NLDINHQQGRILGMILLHTIYSCFLCMERNYLQRVMKQISSDTLASPVAFCELARAALFWPVTWLLAL
ncbi:MAG: hypothetical protein ACRDHW_19580, partial [Ktedonobacteraceae bacterium]